MPPYVLYMLIKIIRYFLLGLLFISPCGAQQKSSRSTNLVRIEEPPVWKIGDTWVYNIEATAKHSSRDINLDVRLPQLIFRVVSVSDDGYTINFFGNFDGSGTLGVAGMFHLSGRLKSAYVEGKMLIEKSDLKIYKIFDTRITGQMSPMNISLGSLLNVDVDLQSITISESLININFPLQKEASWHAPECIIAVAARINSPSIIPQSKRNIFANLHISEHSFQCANIAAKDGYDPAFIVTGELLNYVFAPSAGFISEANKNGFIKLRLSGLEDYYYELSHFRLKLIGTTYREKGL